MRSGTGTDVRKATPALLPMMTVSSSERLTRFALTAGRSAAPPR